MTLEQLRIFVAVAEREHMTAAAREINVTQSAASAAIAALEAQHDVKLFHRIGRGIVLTQEGRVFLEEARGLLARAASAELALDELSDLRRGTLRLVASQTIAAYWLPPMLTAFRVRYPGVSIELTIGNTQQAAARVLCNGAELGIVEGIVDEPLLARWMLGEDQLVLVQRDIPPSRVDLDMLRAARWVMREQGSGTRSVLEAALREAGIEPEQLDVVLVLPSNESVHTAVAAGAGMAALSAFVVAPALAAGTLHALPFAFSARTFYGLRHKECYRSKAADALLKLIEERVSETSALAVQNL